MFPTSALLFLVFLACAHAQLIPSEESGKIIYSNIEVSKSKELMLRLEFGRTINEAQAMNLYPSMKNQALVIVSQDCVECNTNQKLNIVGLPKIQPYIDVPVNITMAENNYLRQLHFYESRCDIISDTIQIPSRDDRGRFIYKAVPASQLYAITSSATDLDWGSYYDGAGYDGVLGLAPKDPETHDFYNSPSLIDKLSRDQYIGQPVFALYISLKVGNTSHIKFGGWDRAAVIDEADPTVLTAISADSFALGVQNPRFRKVVLDQTEIASAVAQFDPGMKYIHLPATHFDAIRGTLNEGIRAALLAAQVTLADGWQSCTESSPGTDTFCKLPGSCHVMKDKGLQLQFSFMVADADSSDQKFTIELSGDEMLVDGMEVNPNNGGENECYIPIMKQEYAADSKTEGTKLFKDTWLMGTHVMNKYYTVYDQSRGFNKPRVGIALKNPDMQKDAEEKKQEEQREFNQAIAISIVALAFVGCILIVICCCKQMKRKTFEDDSQNFEELSGTPRKGRKASDINQSSRSPIQGVKQLSSQEQALAIQQMKVDTLPHQQNTRLSDSYKGLTIQDNSLSQTLNNSVVRQENGPDDENNSSVASAKERAYTANFDNNGRVAGAKQP